MLLVARRYSQNTKENKNIKNTASSLSSFRRKKKVFFFLSFSLSFPPFYNMWIYIYVYRILCYIYMHRAHWIQDFKKKDLFFFFSFLTIRAGRNTKDVQKIETSSAQHEMMNHIIKTKDIGGIWRMHNTPPQNTIIYRVGRWIFLLLLVILELINPVYPREGKGKKKKKQQQRSRYKQFVK